LGSIKDPKTVGPLIEALKDSYWDVRSEAANALSLEHDGSAIVPLLDAVSDTDTTVQASAENALVLLSKDLRAQAKAAVTSAADEFARRLDDANPKVSLVAAVCLALLKDSRSIPVLTKMISSSDAITRLDAVKGLGETGDPSVVPTLRVTLKSTDINMQGWSIIGLGNLKDQGSLADLQALAADTAQPPTIRAAAEAAIRKIVGQTSAQTEP
jgi:HEAT repeat protein